MSLVYSWISGGKDTSYSAQVTKPGGPSKNTRQDVHMQVRSSTTQKFSNTNRVDEHVRHFLCLLCHDSFASIPPFEVCTCIPGYLFTCCSWHGIIFFQYLSFVTHCLFTSLMLKFGLSLWSMGIFEKILLQTVSNAPIPSTSSALPRSFKSNSPLPEGPTQTVNAGRGLGSGTGASSSWMASLKRNSSTK